MGGFREEGSASSRDRRVRVTPVQPSRASEAPVSLADLRTELSGGRQVVTGRGGHVHVDCQAKQDGKTWAAVGGDEAAPGLCTAWWRRAGSLGWRRAKA